MTKKAEANGALRVLKENWFVVIAVISIITTWVTLDNRVSNTEKACENFKKTEEMVQESRSEIGKIKVDLEYLKKGLDRNEALQHEILKELRK